MFCWTQLGKCWASLNLTVTWELSCRPERLSAQPTVAQRQGETGPWPGHNPGPGSSFHTHFLINKVIKCENGKTLSPIYWHCQTRSHALGQRSGLSLSIFIPSPCSCSKNFCLPLRSSFHFGFQGAKKKKKNFESNVQAELFVIIYLCPGVLLDCMSKWGGKMLYK